MRALETEYLRTCLGAAWLQQRCVRLARPLFAEEPVFGKQARQLLVQERLRVPVSLCDEIKETLFLDPSGRAPVRWSRTSASA
jgi:hypothetical protein